MIEKEFPVNATTLHLVDIEDYFTFRAHALVTNAFSIKRRTLYVIS